MTFISIINPKGGVGKTTLSLNLGLLLSAQGRKVIFVDLDPLNSLSDWLSRRPKTLSQFECFKSNCDKIELDNFSSHEDNTIFLLDCPAGMEKAQIAKLSKISDTFLIPVNPSPVDLGALTRFLFKLAANDDKLIDKKAIGLVGNRTKTYTRLHAEILAKIEKLNLPLVGTLRDTQNYTLPASRGMGIVDLPTNRVKIDLENWASILDWLKHSCPLHD